MDAKVTQELKWLFSRLVIDLKQNITLAWQVISLWIWLEDAGFPNILFKLLVSSNATIHFVIKETMVCLDCVEMGTVPTPPFDGIPFIHLLTNGISLQFFHDKRRQAMEGILRVAENIWAKRFQDTELHSIFSSAIQQPIVDQMRMPFDEGSSRGTDDRERMIMPFGEGGSRVGDVRERQMMLGLSPFFAHPNLDAFTAQWNVIVPKEERSMFMTFSRGYPLTQREVQNFLTRLYGDCVESINMQEVVPPNVQSFYALVVFKLASTVEIILNGREKVNFVINGKHARVRRWVPK
ncbi:uncharacterized protein LOC122090031 [Macadamia integrifolia]|uniref:uncharacterized protein LOC122090031 n=1 Tax=Macadamia integrifolia TaxID=60698 RepID=UPI001C4EFE16|nr:uncharacterized protein LOC122090031 [Macadamia integrifolia]